MFNKAPFKRVISMPKFYFILISMLLSSCELSKESHYSQSVVPPQMSNTSFAPYMSKDFSGNPVMSWIDQTGDLNSLKYSVWMGNEWSIPIIVSQGENWLINRADFPSVIQITETTWVAHWLVFTNEQAFAYDVFISISRDGGKTWLKGISPHDDETISEHGFVSFFRDQSDIGVVWLDGREMPLDDKKYQKNNGDHGNGMTLRSAKISHENEFYDEEVIDHLVCDCCQTDIAQTDTGPVLVYRNRTEQEYRDIYFSKMTDGIWESGSSVFDDGWEIGGCPVNGPSVSAKGQKVYVTWFTQAQGFGEVKFKSEIDEGESSKVAVIDKGLQVLGNVNSSIVSDDNIALSWLRSTQENKIELVVAMLDLKTASIKELILDEFDANQRLSVPQLVYSQGELFLSLSKFKGMEQNFYASKLDIRAFDNQPLSKIDWKSDEV